MMIIIITIYVNNLEFECPLGNFTDQATEVTISTFGSGVLYSIRMKMGTIKSLLIKASVKKKKLFFYSFSFAF